jgi:hypothetical protein
LHLDYGKYIAHSFRIGAATSAAVEGCDLETIKRAEARYGFDTVSFTLIFVAVL